MFYELYSGLVYCTIQIVNGGKAKQQFSRITATIQTADLARRSAVLVVEQAAVRVSRMEPTVKV